MYHLKSVDLERYYCTRCSACRWPLADVNACWLPSDDPRADTCEQDCGQFGDNFTCTCRQGFSVDPSNASRCLGKCAEPRGAGWSAPTHTEPSMDLFSMNSKDTVWYMAIAPVGKGTVFNWARSRRLRTISGHRAHDLWWICNDLFSNFVKL